MATQQEQAKQSENDHSHVLSKKEVMPTGKLNFFIKLFSFIKIPLLGFAGPSIVRLTKTDSVVRLPLKWMTKNHFGSMYFGALAMGAELSASLPVLYKIQNEGAKVNFIFKDFSCDFLKRADTHVLFICPEAQNVFALVEKALASPERVEQTFQGYACSESQPEVIFIRYKITLSLKRSDKPAI